MTEARTTVQRGYIHWCGVTCVNRKDTICIGLIMACGLSSLG
jgi:hypothetical protein